MDRDQSTPTPKWQLRQRRRKRKLDELGITGVVYYELHRRLPTAWCRLARLSPKHAMFPVYFRPGTSDLQVFHQIFLDLEYQPLTEAKDVELIIDCGANVGYSSAFFLTQFPAARLVAIEPDENNCQILKRNLMPYGDRARIIQAAVWSRDPPLAFSKTPYRDGGAWAVQVRPCERGEESDLRGISMSTIIEEANATRVSILKIDIEGAEVELFGNSPAWLDKVDNLAIELHDDTNFGPATPLFHQAIERHPFDAERSGELEIYRRRID